MSKIKYQPEMCECCGQTKTYAIAIDRGTVNIMKKIALAIEEKGINCVHLAKEKVLTHNELCNIIRPKFHGLVAHVDGEGMKGNFCLTTKGLDFLKGARIPRYAIVSKAESRQVGYFEPETETVAINDFNESDEYWDGVGFEIVAGRVVRPTEFPVQAQML